ncbi:cytochrome c biogenesis CcdA family protein [Actinokineospora sp. UTMC 2448]|uniref:cytochrome c biogenesis CcdA family protein n=1 Tax=Actinokineospora sp. UTMC 2448 TaxID=2268449 RepID=UPI0021643062|nr:cytochrome c biogenesis CcdA family protein [Actinokineospora sp. UTMC 2448]UVS77690.1 Thiol:disulfide interchange protein [Actinokineospora sp. UTMC 2448]
MTELGVALLAGMLATVNPCGFAMLPGYLALVVSGQDRSVRLGRALAAAGTMTAGFVLVFGVFGLLSVPLLSLLQQWLPVLTVVIGAALVVLGAVLLTGREPTLLLPKLKRGAPTARVGSMLGYGVAYAVASLSCTIGPFLAVAGVSLRQGDVLDGLVSFVTYALGMGLVVAVLAVAAAFSVNTGVRRVLPHVNRVVGGLLVLAGLYVAYYGVHELRVAHADADPDDPIIAAAGNVQATLAEWVDAAGPWPFAVALTLGVGLIALWRANRRSVPDKG